MQRRGLAAVLLAALVAVFAGCGSDSDEFVAVSSNNTGGPVAGSGELAFRFERTNPQTVAPVPQATVTLRFDLYSTTPPTPDTLVFTQSQPYSDQIVLREVPTTAITVVVTAFDAVGLPLMNFAGDFQVSPGVRTQVSLSSGLPITLQSMSVTPDPAIAQRGIGVTFDGTEQTTTLNPVSTLILNGNFSNGESFVLPVNAQTVSFSDPLIASISSSGGLTVAGPDPFSNIGQSTTATATYLASTPNVSDQFQIQNNGFLVGPTAVGADRFGSRFVPAGVPDTRGWQGTLLTSPPTGSETLDLDQSDFSFSLAEPVEGVSINGNSGVMSVNAEVAHGTSFVVLITFPDPVTGITYQAEVEMEVVNFP